MEGAGTGTNDTNLASGTIVVSDDELDLDVSQSANATNIDSNKNGSDTIDDDIVDTSLDATKDKKDGNADTTKDTNLDDKGNTDDNVDELAVVDEIVQLTGFQPVNDKGEPIVYENPNDIKSVAKYIIDSVNHYGKQSFVEEQTKFVERFPLAQDVWDAIVRYDIKDKVQLAKYLDKPDYSSIKLDKENEAQMIDLVIKAEIKRGKKEESARKLVDYYKADGSLSQVAEEELTFLQASDKSEKAAEEVKVAEARKADADKADAYWNDVKTIIAGKKLGDIVLPEQIKVGDKIHTWDDFMTYISVPTENGYTAHQNDEMQLPIENEIWNALLLFSKGSISDLIKREVSTAKAKDLKSRIGMNKLKSDATNGANGNDSRQKAKDDDLDI